MSETPGVDNVPAVSLGAPPQQHTDIQIVGDEAVKMLRDLVSHLDGVSDEKGAILRMIGIFHAAVGRSILIQEAGSPPQQVKGLWR